jgi:hypothetical protein
MQRVGIDLLEVDAWTRTGLPGISATAPVLFVFASPGLSRLLRAQGLPAPPLVPVSSSEAVVGAILGSSLVRRGPVKWRAVGAIVAGWVLAPPVAALASLAGSTSSRTSSAWRSRLPGPDACPGQGAGARICGNGRSGTLPSASPRVRRGRRPPWE